ncbi:sugar transferase [Parachitinimonas caeni]|uniref:Sugar transferase n=1 Tax=Parachitinimonas caeni TaxID=3031301 RepID=A0ABT7DSD3_9NEIS|nr:sugar transferase [Parachitinimonas caeni]MDK2122977.1 sugar transferase [Parachitinimonas caeni]
MIQRLAKRLLDIIGAGILLILLLPVFMVVSLIIRSHGGTAIFGHKRVGRAGQPFVCYKFRTMIPNADQRLKELLAHDPAAREEWERDFKLKDDPRITPIGAILRQTSLDELPQLWNVLIGDMSLVGPRPIVEAEMPRYGADIDLYLSVRPGLTGLWQVSGRNNMSYTERVALDSYYVNNWSLFGDIKIIFKTALVVVRGDGAY